jgi:hypothetical protein
MLSNNGIKFLGTCELNAVYFARPNYVDLHKETLENTGPEKRRHPD